LPLADRNGTGHVAFRRGGADRVDARRKSGEFEVAVQVRAGLMM
jgi:hypothetical protein